MQKADYWMKDCLSFDVKDKRVMMAYSCLLCQTCRYQEAIVLLKGLLPTQADAKVDATIEEEREDKKIDLAIVYLLISYAYMMGGDSEMADKYKVLCHLTKLRELNRIDDAGSMKDHAPKSSQLITAPASSGPSAMSAGSAAEEEPTNEVKSSVGFKNVRLSPSEQDEVTLELAKYLLKQKFHSLAE